MREYSVRQIIEATKGKLLCGDENTLIKDVVIDSRKAHPEALFVPIIGEKNDAHQFLPSVAEAGCKVSLVSKKEVSISEGMTYILVEDTLKALQDIAYAYRREYIHIPLVGITGSVGKTTTREMVAAALSGGYQVFKTPANFNSQIGVPLTLFSIPEDAQIGVIEMGISEPGEMTKISRLVAPDSAVMTNIGVAHIEQLGSRGNICAEKYHICDYMNPEGTLFLNADDDLLSKIKSERKIVYFGKNQVSNISMENGLAKFVAKIDQKEVNVELSVYGKHQIGNALAALSVANCYGVDLVAAAEKLKEFHGFSHRQQIFRKNALTIIDDTYNASPVSMNGAVDILEDIVPAVGGRKIAVLADMKELGEDAEKMHYECGEYLGKKNIHILVHVGELSKEIERGFLHIQPKGEVYGFLDREKMDQFLRNFIRSKDVLLFKGSNSMHLSKSIEELLQNELICRCDH